MQLFMALPRHFTLAALAVSWLLVGTTRAEAASGASASNGASAGHASGATRYRVKVNVTPLQKLIQLLDGMVAKGKKEKLDEQVEFAKFHEWCDGMHAEKTTSIAEAAAQIEQLLADIGKAKADAAVLGEEIADHEAAVAKAEAELKAAAAVREKEYADFSAESSDLSESIDACERAISTLKARSKDVPQMLLQVQRARAVPGYAKAVISAFLDMKTGGSAGAPEANAYEFQSGSVVELLEKLATKFKDQLLTVQKEEMTAKGNFQLLKQQLTDDIAADNKATSEKKAAKAGKLEDAEEAKGAVKVTEKTKADDETVLADTLAECLTRSNEFEKNQGTRADEVKAIEGALSILSSDVVKGNAETYLPTLLQVPKSNHHGRALVQQPRGSDAAVRQRVLEFLQGKAKRLGSTYLAMAAAHVQSDPFGKVKKMIKDLIVKLMEQTNAEADEHGYCTTEMATNKETRENKASEVEQLTATVEKLTAESAELASEIQELTDDIAEIKGQQAEATKIRSEERATNSQTAKDAKEAAMAVQRATEVLKEFYSKAAEAALLQGGADGRAVSEALRSEMAAADKGKAPYKGMQASSGGIFGLLEVVLSDFTRLEAETLADEESAQSSFEKFMDESTENVAVKEAEVEHKTNSRQIADEKNMQTKKELGLTQAELDKALNYYDKLKEQCADTGLSYEERKKAREEEIQSLKEALAILEQQDLA